MLNRFAICIPITQVIKFFRYKNIKSMNNFLTDHRVDDTRAQMFYSTMPQVYAKRVSRDVSTATTSWYTESDMVC